MQAACSRKDSLQSIETACAECYERPMEFRILGSLRVCDGDREITVSGHKQRRLLALLLLHANQSVSEDVLIEALWGEGASRRQGATSTSSFPGCARRSAPIACCARPAAT